MWNVRRCKLRDIFLLQDLSVQTYYDTFKGSTTREEMHKYLDENFGTRKLMDELRDSNSFFYFAYWDKELVGYMKLNLAPSQTDIKDEDSLEIERFYVVKRFQRKKIGSKLMEMAIEVAKELNKNYLWLGVWEENHKAQRFYRYAGFKFFGKNPFKMGDRTQTNLLMRKDLMVKWDEDPGTVYGPTNSYGV